MRLLLVVVLGGCAPFIDGTDVRQPAAQHDGFDLVQCQAPPEEVLEPRPQACCTYLGEAGPRMVCNWGEGWLLTRLVVEGVPGISRTVLP